MSTDTATPQLSAEEIGRQLDKLATVTISAVIPRGGMLGGWGDPISAGKDEPSKCHYFRVVGRAGTNPDHVHLVSICGQFDAEGLTTELIDCDPLAPENCPRCRTVLLIAQRLLQ